MLLTSGFLQDQDQQESRAPLYSRTESGLGAESFDKDKKLGGGCTATCVLRASVLPEATACEYTEMNSMSIYTMCRLSLHLLDPAQQPDSLLLLQVVITACCCWMMKSTASSWWSGCFAKW